MSGVRAKLGQWERRAQDGPGQPQVEKPRNLSASSDNALNADEEPVSEDTQEIQAPGPSAVQAVPVSFMQRRPSNPPPPTFSSNFSTLPTSADAQQETEGLDPENSAPTESKGVKQNRSAAAELAAFVKYVFTLPALPPKEEIKPPNVQLCIGAGMLAGLKLTIGVISFASLVFTTAMDDEITQGLPSGISMYLLSTAVTCAYIALFSNFQYVVASPQDTPSLVLAEMSVVVSRMLDDEDPGVKLPTMFFLIVISSWISSLVFLLIGYFKASSYVQVTPYPVIGGFLASVGITSIRGAFTLMAGTAPEKDLAKFLRPESLLAISLGLGVLAALRVLPSRMKLLLHSKGFYILGNMSGILVIILPIPLFFIVLLGLGYSIGDAQDGGFLFDSVPQEPFYSLWEKFEVKEGLSNMLRVLWAQVSNANIFEMVGLCIITCLLNVAGLSASDEENTALDFDHELKVAGQASLLASSIGGTIGLHQLGTSINTRKDGGTHRLSGLTAAAFCFAVFVSGVPVTSVIPKFVLGGIFLNIGYTLMRQWLYDARPSMATRDYNIMLTIVIVTLFAGILAGLVVGLVMSTSVFIARSAARSPVVCSMRADKYVKANLDKKKFASSRGTGDPNVHIIKFQGMLFFGVTLKVNQALSDALHGEGESGAPMVIILDMALTDEVDATILKAFVKFIQTAEGQGVPVVFCGMRSKVRHTFLREQVAEAIKGADASLADNKITRVYDEQSGTSTYVRDSTSGLKRRVSEAELIESTASGQNIIVTDVEAAIQWSVREMQLMSKDAELMQKRAALAAERPASAPTTKVGMHLQPPKVKRAQLNPLYDSLDGPEDDTTEFKGLKEEFYEVPKGTAMWIGVLLALLVAVAVAAFSYGYRAY
ncbi:hypothetical protein CYMTET_16949, partial [Cymbomonas tetramitiformis]